DDVRRGVAPAQAALRDLVERRGALRRELAEDAPGLLAEVARDVRALTRHPASDGDGRDGSDALEALLDDRVERVPRLARASHHVGDALLAVALQLLAEPAKVGGRGSAHACHYRHEHCRA